MKKAFITFWGLMLSGITLNAKTLEIREYTIIGKDPILTQALTVDQAMPFEKKGMVFDASLSLPVPHDGEIIFRDLKPVSYPSEWDDKGKILKESSRQVGISVKADLSKEKGSETISLRCDYDHSTPKGNSVTALPNGKLLYQPVFSTFGTETTLELIPNQGVIKGGLLMETKSGERKILAFKLVE